MDLDLEEALLQVAGRSRGAASGRKAAKRRQSSEEDDDDEEESEEELAWGKGDKGGRRGAPAKSGRSGKRAKAGQDEHEGDGYGSDLYRDEEDRVQLEAMTELEREMILAERAEERDKARQRRDLLRNTRQADPSSQSQATAGRQRASSRQKQLGDGGKDAAIRRYTAARKQQGKGFAGESEDEDDGDDDGSYEDSEGEEDEDGEGAAPTGRRPSTRASKQAEVGKQQRGRGAPAAAPEEEDDDDEGLLRDLRREDYEDEEAAEPEELRSIQLTREQMEAMVDKPFFTADGLNGALVRVVYGAPVTDKDGNQQGQYWMMRIVGIIEHDRTYPFGPKRVPCNKRLVLQDGFKVERRMPCTLVSNAMLNEEEMARFTRHAVKKQEPPLSKAHVAAVRERIVNARNYRWDAAKVKEMLARKREAGARPVNMAVEKARLRELIAAAHEAGDQGAIAMLGLEMNQLESRAAAKPLDARPGMFHVNKRNMDANFQNSLRNVSSRPANAPASKGKADAFSRRATVSRGYWNTKSMAGQEGPLPPLHDPAAVAALARDKAAQAAAMAVALGKGIPIRADLKRLAPSELIKRLPLQIDLTPLEHQLSGQSLTGPTSASARVLGFKWYRTLSSHQAADLTGRTVMTLADWHRRAETDMVQ